MEVCFGLSPSHLLLSTCLLPPLCQFPIPSTKIGQSDTKAKGLSLDKSQREDTRGRHKWQTAHETNEILRGCPHGNTERPYSHTQELSFPRDRTYKHIPRAYTHTIVVRFHNQPLLQHLEMESLLPELCVFGTHQEPICTDKIVEVGLIGTYQWTNCTDFVISAVNKLFDRHRVCANKR